MFAWIVAMLVAGAVAVAAVLGVPEWRETVSTAIGLEPATDENAEDTVLASAPATEPLASEPAIDPGPVRAPSLDGFVPTTPARRDLNLPVIVPSPLTTSPLPVATGSLGLGPDMPERIGGEAAGALPKIAAPQRSEADHAAQWSDLVEGAGQVEVRGLGDTPAARGGAVTALVTLPSDPRPDRAHADAPDASERVPAREAGKVEGPEMPDRTPEGVAEGPEGRKRTDPAQTAATLLGSPDAQRDPSPGASHSTPDQPGVPPIGAVPVPSEGPQDHAGTDLASKTGPSSRTGGAAERVEHARTGAPSQPSGALDPDILPGVRNTVARIVVPAGIIVGDTPPVHIASVVVIAPVSLPENGPVRPVPMRDENDGYALASETAGKTRPSVYGAAPSLATPSVPPRPRLGSLSKIAALARAPIVDPSTPATMSIPLEDVMLRSDPTTDVRGSDVSRLADPITAAPKRETASLGKTYLDKAPVIGGGGVATDGLPNANRTTDRALAIVNPSGGFVRSVVLDRIGYDEDGSVVLSGRGKPGNVVQVYTTAGVVIRAVVNPEGQWTGTVASEAVTEVRALRVDEMAPSGAVQSQIEAPFVYAREAPKVLRERRVVIQRGDTLWGIARQYYGAGIRFAMIYGANTELIRDPDLIYPGQVFLIPELVDAE